MADMDDHRIDVRFVLPTGDINCGDCDVRLLAEPEPDRRAFAKFKHLLRKAAARSRRNHLPTECANYFRRYAQS
jgi:hypothetical protein